MVFVLRLDPVEKEFLDEHLEWAGIIETRYASDLCIETLFILMRLD